MLAADKRRNDEKKRGAAKSENFRKCMQFGTSLIPIRCQYNSQSSCAVRHHESGTARTGAHFSQHDVPCRKCKASARTHSQLFYVTPQGSRHCASTRLPDDDHPSHPGGPSASSLHGGNDARSLGPVQRRWRATPAAHTGWISAKAKFQRSPAPHPATLR